MNIPSLTPQAYELHFLVGLVIAAIASYCKRDAFGLILFLAIGKEIFDFSKHGKPDILDVVFTLFGWCAVKIKRCLLVIIILLALPSISHSQTYWKHLQKNRLSYGLMFTGGMANGVSDALQHKYRQTIFPQGEGEKFLGFERDYFDPRMSWTRKYKNWPDDPRPAFPGSKTVFVWTTDAWHLTKSVQLKSMQGAIITYRPPTQGNKWWWTIADLAIHSLCFSTGFHLSQKLVIK